MPLNGRNLESLLSLRPGVMMQAGGGPWTQSTNGIRPDETTWMIEGVINSNWYDSRPIAGSPSPITDGASILPIDAIQEFNPMENPKAEYGWKPGAVVNVGLKSGTNSFHGTAYGFIAAPLGMLATTSIPPRDLAEHASKTRPRPQQLKQLYAAKPQPN